MTTTTGTCSHRQAEEEVDWMAWIAADDDDEHYSHGVVVSRSRVKEGTTRKRLYEHGEWEEDREMDKMYKRDYWHDPAKASLLQHQGLAVARAEAVLCFSERVLRDSAAMRAQRWQEHVERRSSRGVAADDDQEPEPETTEPAGAATAAGDGRRLFFAFWRSIVDNLAALLRYFLG